MKSCGNPNVMALTRSSRASASGESSTLERAEVVLELREVARAHDGEHRAGPGTRPGDRDL